MIVIKSNVSSILKTKINSNVSATAKINKHLIIDFKNIKTSL